MKVKRMHASKVELILVFHNQNASIGKCNRFKPKLNCANQNVSLLKPQKQKKSSTLNLEQD